MPSRKRLPVPHRPRLDDGEATPTPWVSTLSYRSRASTPLSDEDLHQLLKDCRTRNHAEGVTGVMIYDEGRFCQWLEGPDEAIERIWDSVRHDPRHHAIELLGRHTAPMRFFAECDMKLCEKHSPGNLLTMPLAPQAGRSVAHAHEADMAERSAQLAHLLLSTESAHAAELVQCVAQQSSAIETLCGSLFEPAARHLGDLWQADECNEFDVALGLGRLQACWRELRAGSPRTAVVDSPALLVAPCPGESHMIGAALHADMLWQAGWDAQVEFPSDDDALDKLLAANWFGAVDLTLSASFRREHWLPRLATTIARARAASCNPSLVVVVGGRVFDDERLDACSQVGADAACSSASNIESTIAREMAKVHCATWAALPGRRENRSPPRARPQRPLPAADDLTH